MDILLDKKEWQAGEEVRGHFVFPKDVRDNEPLYPQIRLAFYGQEYARVDLQHSLQGGPLLEPDAIALLDRDAMQETHVFWQETVTVSPQSCLPEIPHQWIYPFSITLPDNLPATRTFQGNNVNRYGISRIQYLLRVQIPRAEQLSSVWESTLATVTDSMRDNCLDPLSLFAEDLLLIDKEEKDNKTHRHSKDDGSSPSWETLGRSWDVCVRACPWKETTQTLHIQVDRRMELSRSGCCGIYETKQVSFALEITADNDDDAKANNNTSVKLWPGQTLFYTLSDPKKLLREELAMWNVQYVIQPKLSQHITWEAKRHRLVFPLQKQWDMPSHTLEVSSAMDLSLQDGITDENKSTPDVLAQGKLEIPSFLADTYKGTLIQVEIHLMFSLQHEDGSLAGATQRLALQVRG